jgi:hypothetical protein
VARAITERLEELEEALEGCLLQLLMKICSPKVDGKERSDRWLSRELEVALQTASTL